MPNGKVGDNWFTDIVEHKLPTFSTRADQLVVEINELIPEPRPPELIGLVEGFLAGVGWEALVERGRATVDFPWRQLQDDEVRRLEEALEYLRDIFARSGRGAY